MKLKRYLAVAAFLVYSPVLFSQQITPIPLTGESKISLITCSPGEELYSVFGHSAIRVKDPNLNMDVVFNYGTFDFATPNFYMKFVKGKLNYILSVNDYSNFLYEYMLEERWVIEQVLDISLEEKQFLFDSLRINYLPENREYLYDFFFDNCATRIRDVYYEGLNKVSFDYSEVESDKSFRDLLKPYIENFSWVELGINLALGSKTDRTAIPWEYMFLPDHMLDIFRYARIERDSVPDLLCYPEVILLEGKELNDPGIKLYDPLWILWTVFVLGTFLTFFDLKRKKPSLWFDGLLFGSAGLLGILITFLWFGTDHTVTGSNYNLLWAVPFHFPLMFIVFRKKWPVIIRKYFFVTSVILLLIVVFWRILPQELPVAMLPLILLMIIRSLVLSKHYQRKAIK